MGMATRRQGTWCPDISNIIFSLSQREDWQQLQHPETLGSLYDHTRKSASQLTGMEVLVKKYGIVANPQFKKNYSLADTREAAEPFKKATKTQRWDNWVRDSPIGKGDIRLRPQARGNQNTKSNKTGTLRLQARTKTSPQIRHAHHGYKPERKHHLK